MKIGIVLHPYDEDRPAGLARTIYGFTKGMLSVDRENEYIIFVKKNPRIPPVLSGKNWRLEPMSGGRLWLHEIKKIPVDVCIFNTPVISPFYKKEKTVVLALDYGYWYIRRNTIVGLIRRYITYFINFYSLHRAGKIIAISEATKEETIKLFKVSPKKIEVIYCGYDKICDISEKKRDDLPQKYFLFVGMVKRRKNVARSVEAFYEFQKKHSGFSFVVAGNTKNAYCDGIRKYVREKGISEKVVFIDYPSDAELSYIYRNAFALCFPTLVEGFGYPVLEGMGCGIPVITSNRSSLKEVGGGGSALLVNPDSTKEIAGAMSRLADNPGLREKLIEKGFSHIKNFSWEKTGQETVRFLKSLVS
jgi:glycosyltransferase involved in cell wall biosynthesis